MGHPGDAWVDAVELLGGDRHHACDTAADLELRYAEPHRRYHTNAHVEAVLRDTAWLAGGLGLDADDRATVALAACAHDVVYDARPGADERASAAWARTALSAASLPEGVVQRVEQLVLLTVTHAGPAGDRGAAALLDADLAILGAEQAAYTGYVAAVREEYAAVPDELWRRGRARLLEDLLARESIFGTEAARGRWEVGARLNVRRELAELGT